MAAFSRSKARSAAVIAVSWGVEREGMVVIVDIVVVVVELMQMYEFVECVTVYSFPRSLADKVICPKYIFPLMSTPHLPMTLNVVVRLLNPNTGFPRLRACHPTRDTCMHGSYRFQ